MKEVLRILHGKQKTGNSDILRDYNLEVYEGEVVYIQGLSGSGLSALLQVLAGKEGLDEGSLYIGEKMVEIYPAASPLTHGIYIVTEKQDLVGNLTVAENLELLQYGKKFIGLYNRNAVMEKVGSYLRQEGMEINPETPVRNLSLEECQKLSIIKGRMCGARLIVLDCTKGYYEGRLADELARLIRRISEEGIAFIILAEQMPLFAHEADRIQLMRHGKDLMEWNHIEGGILHGRDFTAIETADKILEGFFDYDWEMSRSIWSYIRTIKDYNEDFWTQNICLELLPEGCYCRKRTVLIPKESALQIIDNMEIRQNATLTVKNRISRNVIGYIPDALVDNVTEEFYRITGLSHKIKYPSELSYVERKILSVYRWEIAKPDTIFFESPYWGMDLKESDVFHRYLLHLAEKGIRVLLFSKSLSELKRYCNKIIITENGRNAVLLTGRG